MFVAAHEDGTEVGQDLTSIHFGAAPELAEVDRPYSEAMRNRRSGLTVDTSVRSEVVAFFYNVYEPARLVPSGWTGNIAACDAGFPSAAFKDATIHMVNYYRAMAGLPGDVVHDVVLNSKCQQAALVMAANGQVNFNPPQTWKCYTAEGAEAAEKSLISLGISGARAVSLFMGLPPESDPYVAFRRWILFPPLATMGTGTTGTGFAGSSVCEVLWVLGPFGSRPIGPEFVAWPPEGFVPYTVVYPRWSFSIQGANFSSTTITMTKDGQPMAATLTETLAPGFGDSTVAWTPTGVLAAVGMQDTTYSVTLTNVIVSGVAHTFQYQVTIIDPALVPTVPQADGLRIF